jgi:FMN phosphatase YigB (HAD superfamily)
MSTIRIIGFDLDQTLFPKSPEIDEAIQEYLYQKIAAHHHNSIEEARKMFYSYYPVLSGRKTIEKLGLANANELMQEALERADIAKFLKPSPKVVHLLSEIRAKYGSLSLLTGSDSNIAQKKLHALEIPLALFDFIVYGATSKSTGEAYQKWIDYFRQKDPSLKPQNFLYIGDRYSSDVEAPEKLGIQAWLVNTEKGKYPDTKTFENFLDVRNELLK